VAIQNVTVVVTRMVTEVQNVPVVVTRMVTEVQNVTVVVTRMVTEVQTEKNDLKCIIYPVLNLKFNSIS
jgi:hypothetical protein